uniref:PREDICTED: polyproteinlike putative n=1 Tax=Albugo laibachii Nc14 TaxID=890382 RepID=F0WXK7_9STRA|nr:PREDICTED: polyproteinlike putative [Albugo laibachii Nc14]|eukprot:CCA26201.1 PREDICTED: polyproteinlike putative [Albugo laibachii Nc14]
MSWPMPHVEVVMNNLEGSECFFSLDCFRFYWQLPCEEKSCEYFTIVTPNELWNPNRVIMGATDAVAFCKQAIERVMAPRLDSGVQVWLVDILGNSQGESKMLSMVTSVLSCCEQFGVKLHPGKCEF